MAKFSSRLWGIALVIVLLFAVLPAVFERHTFLAGASVHEATIVKVDQRERRRKRLWGSVEYIPIVEISDKTGSKIQLEVDDYSTSPAYQTGERMKGLYNPAVPGYCIINSPSEKWGDIVGKLCWYLFAFFSTWAGIQAGYVGSGRYAYFGRFAHFKRIPPKLSRPAASMVERRSKRFIRRGKRR